MVLPGAHEPRGAHALPVLRILVYAYAYMLIRCSFMHVYTHVARVQKRSDNTYSSIYGTEQHVSRYNYNVMLVAR